MHLRVLVPAVFRCIDMEKYRALWFHHFANTFLLDIGSVMMHDLVVQMNIEGLPATSAACMLFIF